MGTVHVINKHFCISRFAFCSAKIKRNGRSLIDFAPVFVHAAFMFIHFDCFSFTTSWFLLFLFSVLQAVKTDSTHHGDSHLPISLTLE